ncbi:MAG: hypothetical protein ACKOUM_05085 [Sphingopyxis sp.]
MKAPYPMWICAVVPLLLALLAFAVGQIWAGAGMIVVLGGSALWCAIAVRVNQAERGQ